MEENIPLDKCKSSDDDDTTVCRKTGKNLEIDGERRPSQNIQRSSMLDFAELEERIERQDSSKIQYGDIKFIDENDSDNKLGGSTLTLETPLSPLSLKNTSECDHLLHQDCITNEEISQKLINTTNKTKDLIYPEAQSYVDEAKTDLFDGNTNRVNFAKNLLGMIEQGEGKRYDRENNRVYQRHLAEKLTYENSCFDADALLAALLSYHHDSKGHTRDMRKENPVAAAVAAAAETAAAAAGTDASHEYSQVLADKLSKRRNTFKEFCEETNLNGWHFISKKNSYSRIFWSLVISISIALAIFSTFVIISEFLEANIIITIDSVTSSLDKVVFPTTR
jgi:hypothetical protein